MTLLSLLPDNVISILQVVIQVDGADSSSDDDDDVDDDDDDDNDNDIENNDELEEEPLNSDDDVTDDEKQDQFETDNVIVCQYDKVRQLPRSGDTRLPSAT